MTAAAAARFGDIAENYRTSDVHRSSPTMARLGEVLALGEHAAIVDVGCGPGHLGFALLPRQGSLAAVDPSPAMLKLVRERARDAGVELAVTLLSFSEDIDLPSETFDAAVSRLAAHHFADLTASLREMRRLVVPGGRVAVIDLEGYEDRELALFNDEIERRHDPTHVWSRSPGEWREAVSAAGLELLLLEGGCRESADGVPLEEWCRIAASPPGAAAAIGRLLRMRPHLTARLAIQEHGDTFRIPVRTVLVLARKPAD